MRVVKLFKCPVPGPKVKADHLPINNTGCCTQHAAFRAKTGISAAHYRFCSDLFSQYNYYCTIWNNNQVTKMSNLILSSSNAFLSMNLHEYLTTAGTCCSRYNSLWVTWAANSIQIWQTLRDSEYYIKKLVVKGTGKSVPLQAWSDPEGSRKLRFPDFMTTAQEGGKVVSHTHRPHLTPGNPPGTHLC